MKIVVVVPVLGRPGRAAAVADSFAAARTVPSRLLFVVSPGDDAQAAACRATGLGVLAAGWDPGPGDFARKVNLAFRETSEPFLFQAADDVRFGHGWDAEALRIIDATQTGVCGTQDGANPRVRAGLHSTHSLIRRSYVDECGGSADGPGVVFHEGYGHMFVDTELVELAKSRGCFSFAGRAEVLHAHPIYDRAVDLDATYRKGMETGHADRLLYQRRSRGW